MKHEPTPQDLAAEEAIAAIEQRSKGLIPTFEVLHDTFLAIANAFFGVCEVGKTNSGYWIDRFLANCHLGPNQYWCQAYAQWCLWRACRMLGLPDILPYDSASTRAVWDWAAIKGLTVTDPQFMHKGDMLIFSSGGTRLGHVAVIVLIEIRAGAYVIHTIEGNIGGGSRRNGGQVDHREYTIAQLRLRKPTSKGLWCRGAVSLQSLYEYAKIDPIAIAEAQTAEASTAEAAAAIDISVIANAATAYAATSDAANAGSHEASA